LSVYEKLDVRKVVNAQGTMSYLGGSVLPPEILEAWVEASKSFVLMDELRARTGEIIAELTGSEYGCVTAGADAGLSLATAACMAGKDPEKYQRLPDTAGMKNEVIIPRICRNIHNRAFIVPGAELVFVGDEDGFTENDIDEAVTERTAAVAFVFFTDPKRGYEALAKAIKAAKKHGLPVIVDAAAETPPRENLTRLIAMGSDLVAFSGGKDIQAPNDTGLLFGRRELVEAAVLQERTLPPFGIGRSMKVSKEDIASTAVALQRYLAKDVDAERANWERRAKSFMAELGQQPHVEARLYYPNPEKDYVAQCWPVVHLVLDEEALGVTAAKVSETLKGGNPRVYVGQGGNTITVNPHCLADGEEKFIAQELKRILRQAAD